MRPKQIRRTRSSTLEIANERNWTHGPEAAAVRSRSRKRDGLSPTDTDRSVGDSRNLASGASGRLFPARLKHRLQDFARPLPRWELGHSPAAIRVRWTPRFVRLGELAGGYRDRGRCGSRSCGAGTVLSRWHVAFARRSSSGAERLGVGRTTRRRCEVDAFVVVDGHART